MNKDEFCVCENECDGVTLERLSFSSSFCHGLVMAYNESWKFYIQTMKNTEFRAVLQSIFYKQC